MFSLCGRKLLSRSNLLKIPDRNGWIVLVPEIGEDLPQKNPLLKDNKNPEFNTLTIEKCVAAVSRQTVEFEEGINNIGEKLKEKENIDLMDDIMNPIEDIYVPLEITWGIAKALYFGNQTLMPTKCYFGIHERANRATASKFINQPIYQACKNILNDKEAKLTDLQKRLAAKFVLEGKLNGLDLTDKQRNTYFFYTQKIVSKSTEYREKYEAATKLFSYTIQNPVIVQDFPEELLKSIAADPAQPHVGPWTITLKPFVLRQFMEYCPNRNLRYKLWEADVTRNSMNERFLQTSSPLEDIRHYRNEQAKLIGYKSYAHMSMETKMVESLEQLYEIFDILLQAARPIQEKEIKELNEFAEKKGSVDVLDQWDIPYWGRRYCRSVYNCKEEIVKEFFPLPKVLSKSFELVESLFNIKIVENKKADVWHKDVWFFDVFDLNQSSVEPIANFYLDPYARGDEKLRLEQNSGWMIAMRNRSVRCKILPLSALIFNFQPPKEDKPSMLTFNDVRIFFQKLGHTLQHLLTTVEHVDLAGLSNVEWDAAHISDYFLENLLYESSTLQQISGHYDTGEPLPEEMITVLQNTKFHLAGYNLCKELYFSRLDIELHSRNEFWNPMMKRLWKEHFVIPLHKKDWHPCSFETIVTGGWGGAYFSHLYSRMLAADLYNAFHEVPSDSEDEQKKVGNRYRDTFLALGGSYPAAEIFRKFRGRDPSPKALIKNLRLQTNTKDPVNQ